jgi:signal peptidase I
LSRKGRRRGGRSAKAGGGSGAKRAGVADRARSKGVDVAAEETEQSLPRRVWDQVGPILVAVGIALLIRAMVIESYYVPSGSMFPTLLIGDHVFVNKFVYGSHVPFTGITLPALREPKRGELVVFALGRGPQGRICPLDECPGFAPEGFVKRIVALPGDRVSYRRGVFYLDGEPVPATDTGETFRDDGGREYRVLREELPGCSHLVLDYPRLDGPEAETFTVPEGRYFLMGDNRDNSKDSRIWGTVALADLKGPVLVSYWSWNNQESWLAMLNPLTWLRLLWSQMRWGRIGMTYSCE